MVKLMKKLILCLLSAVAVLFVTCSYPIFYAISLEEKKLDPKIPGSPTNFAVFQNQMYVASGEILFMYIGTDSNRKDRGYWVDNIKPGGKIFAIASAHGHLYVLCEESDKKFLKRSANGRNFTNVDIGAHEILAIYSANDQLFIGAGKVGNNLYILNGNTLEKIKDTGNMLLNGAAYNGTYYLTAKDLISETGGCIYTGTLSEMTQIGNNIPFVGIINLENTVQTIVAIDQDGKLYYVVPSLNQAARLSNSGRDYPATGALAIWRDENNQPRLLLAGRQDNFATTTNSGYTYGYLEININENGVYNNFREPGLDTVSTVAFGVNEKYNSSIGKLPVNDIFQSREDRIIFASTQKEGVYSYRERDEGWSWNAEEAE
jgi:hypothetical protein